ncbi:MAG: hypothetical protein AAGI01_16165, partial [Myxococcota bacterium]
AIGQHFSATWAILEAFSAQRPAASAVRIWPHHFDVAVLCLRDVGADPESSASVNVGMSAGDRSSDEPYWYAVPYPAPQEAPDVALPSGGRWQVEGFFGALLASSEVTSLPSSEAQGEALASFLQVAFDASMALL